MNGANADSFDINLFWLLSEVMCSAKKKITETGAFLDSFVNSDASMTPSVVVVDQQLKEQIQSTSSLSTNK